MNIKRAAFVGVACALAAAGLGACGSDSEDRSSASTTPTKQTFTGKPIVIGTEATLDSPIGSFPESFAGVKAAAKAINAAGGIKGREVKVVTCNGKFDPNQEAGCARQLVKAGAVAVIGAFPIANVDGFSRVLDEANVANVAFFGDFGPAYQYDNGFPIDFMVGAHYGCLDGDLAQRAAETNEVRVMLGDSAVERAAIKSYQAAARALGSTARIVLVPNSATDLSPVVQQAANKGDGIVVMNVPPTQQIGILTAEAQAGRSWAQCLFDVITPEQRIKLGAALSNAYISSTFPPLTETKKYPLLADFADQMKALADAGDKDARASDDSGRPAWALRSWLGMEVVKQVVEQVDGEITRASFLAAIDQAKVDLGGVVPPIDFSKPVSAGKDYPRVFNPRILITRWDAEKRQVVEVPELDPIDTAEALRR